MRVNAALGLALLVAPAAGQEPQPKPPTPPVAPSRPALDAAKKAEADRAVAAVRTAVRSATEAAVDAQIAAALQHDPDVLVARAKVQLAEAELTKARQTAVTRVTGLRAAVEDAQRATRSAEAAMVRADEQHKTGAIHSADLAVQRDKLGAAMAHLARAEAELKAATTGDVLVTRAAPVPTTFSTEEAFALYLADLARRHLSGGPPPPAPPFPLVRPFAPSAPGTGGVPDRLRVLLEKKVKLGARGKRWTADEVLLALKRDGGFDVPIRLGPAGAGGFPDHVVAADGDELPIGGWLQLLEDGIPGYAFYVRDYGLLLTDSKSAPPDAPTVTQFRAMTPPLSLPKPASP